jgi:hypothetical protein
LHEVEESWLMGAPITIKRRTVTVKKTAGDEQSASSAPGTISGNTVNVRLPAHDEGRPSANPNVGVSGNTVNVKLPASGTLQASAPAPAPAEKPRLARAEKPVREEPEEEAVFVSQPKPTGSAKGVSSRATAVAAVFALIAFLMLLFVILLQVTEYYDLQSLFPGELGIGMLLAAFPW